MVKSLVNFMTRLPPPENHGEVRINLKKRRIFAIVLFLSPLFLMFLFAIWSFIYTPEKQYLLFNHLGGIYRQEDLTKTTWSEGETKQFVFRSLQDVFTINHVSLSRPDVYKEILSGKKPTSLPDHRDRVRPIFSELAFEQMEKSLLSSPWMSDFYEQKRRLLVSFYSPPIQDGDANGFEMNSEGKLSIKYRGSFYVTSVGYKAQERLFRVDYQISLERKPNNVSQALPTYFFAPLVLDNLAEWRISQISWDAKRER